MSLHKYSINQLEEMLDKKEISAQELTDMSVKQIKAVDNDIQAFLTVTEEEALKNAKAVDEGQAAGKSLAGIPASIKDNIVTKGTRTTCASKMLENFTDPLYDATIVEKLNEAGAISVGKVNLDEFAMGSTTETSAFQKTKNPWNTDHVPGGSSGGSAASVAAGEVIFSIGSDTGGSIRQPAAFCGVTGMKPTYGLVSRYGLVPMAPSLDQAGPITRTVADNARVLQAIAGHDVNDATSSKQAVPDYAASLKEDVKGLKIAVPKQFMTDMISEEVREAVNSAVKVFESLGAVCEEVDMPNIAYAESAYYIISSAESASAMARYDSVRYGHRAESAESMIDMYKQSRTEGFGKEVKRRIMLGTAMLSGEWNEAYFRKAQKVRTIITNEFKQVLSEYDLILGPTTAQEAFKLNETPDKQVTQMNDRLTTSVNLAGVPGLSVPAGFTKSGLPLGIQLIGNHFDESTVYRAGYTFEQATGHTEKLPTIGGSEQ